MNAIIPHTLPGPTHGRGIPKSILNRLTQNSIENLLRIVNLNECVRMAEVECSYKVSQAGIPTFYVGGDIGHITTYNGISSC